MVTSMPPSDSKRQADLKTLMNECPWIFDGTCHQKSGPPCHFQLVENARPVAMRGSCTVSVPLLPRVKSELDNLESAMIIRNVAKLTAWVHPFLALLKKNGDIRLVIDFRE
jgi:hypothetical protein